MPRKQGIWTLRVKSLPLKMHIRFWDTQNSYAISTLIGMQYAYIIFLWPTSSTQIFMQYGGLCIMRVMQNERYDCTCRSQAPSPYKAICLSYLGALQKKLNCRKWPGTGRNRIRNSQQKGFEQLSSIYQIFTANSISLVIITMGTGLVRLSY